MTTQEYVDCVSQVNSVSKEDLIELLLKVIKTKMRISKITTTSFVFFGSRYTIEAPEKKIKRDNERNNV